jgi:diguanylate cyclase (GGDEF)-like protein
MPNTDVKKNAKILVIDDAPDVLALLEQDLEELDYDIYMASNREDGLRILTEKPIDLVLLDIIMPNLSGLDLLKEIKLSTRYRDLPVIMLSGSEVCDDIVSALDSGASDFVKKPYILPVLLARIRNALRLKEKTFQLETMALTDFLTGINNRRQFYQLAKSTLARNKRQDSTLCVSVFDIDHFKYINDTYGHEVGDFVLIDFAKRLTTFFREYDIVARVGGEEFCVCLPDTTSEQGLSACERFRSEISRTGVRVRLGKSYLNLSVKVSVGIAYAKQDDDLEELINQADRALYKAKEAGRNQVILFEKHD